MIVEAARQTYNLNDLLGIMSERRHCSVHAGARYYAVYGNASYALERQNQCMTLPPKPDRAAEYYAVITFVKGSRQ